MTAALVERPTPLSLQRDRLHRFSVDQYHSMIASGILPSEVKVELLEGLVVEKMGQNPPHSSTLRKILRLLAAVVPGEYIVSPQLPITLATSEPEPDIAIVVGPEDRYDTRHPGAADVLLVIEVADETLAKDRRNKAQIYAGAGIAEYWIVNIPSATIEVHTKPLVGGTLAYGEIEIYPNSRPIPLKLRDRLIGELCFHDILL